MSQPAFDGHLVDGGCCCEIAMPGTNPSLKILRQYSSMSAFDIDMTLPATGSEMNSGAVISRKETQEKFPFYSNFPVFSI